MSEAGEPQPRGSIDTLRSIGATILALLHNRIDLALLELREEGERRKAVLVLGVVAAVFLSMALLLGAVTVVVIFWDTHRVAAAVGVTVLYAAIGVGAFLKLRGQQDAAPAPFEATLAELRKDAEALRGPDPQEELPHA